MKTILIKVTALFIYISTNAIVSAEEDKLLRIPIKKNYISPQNRRLRQRDTTSTPLYNANGKEYLIQIGVGTPPQYFNVTLDTGSADFWVPSAACPIAMCPHARFKNQTSSTFKSLPQLMDIEYGIGSAKGSYGSDTVTLGSASLSNQTIGLVSKTNDILSATDTDQSNGIFGIGYPNLSMKTGQKPGNFIMGLYQSKVISQPIFSIFLNSQFAYGNSGEIVLGGTDPSKYTGEIQYAPVVTYDASQFYVSPIIGGDSASKKNSTTYLYWAIPGQGVSTSTGYKTSNNSLQAYILDTGTTLTYVPEAIAKSIVMSVTSNARSTVFDALSGVYNVDCSLYKKTDVSVQFMISTSASTMSTTSITINVPVSELVIPLDGALTPDTSSSCMFGIAPAPTGLGLTAGETWILGEATLRSLYTVYDMQENRVGLAKLSAGAATTNSTSSTSASSAGSSNSSGSPRTSASSSSAADSSSSSMSSNLKIPSYLFTQSVLFLTFISYYL